MDAIRNLYLTTEGRLSRKQWWLGVLGLFCVGIVLSVIASMAGYGMIAGIPTIDPANPDPVAFSAATAEIMRRGAWVSLVLFLVVAYPSYCLSIKRRHDRDSAGRDVLIAMVLNVVVLLIQAFGLGLTSVDAGNGITVPAPSPLMMVVSACLGLFSLYLLVVLGFLRGTPGSNSYGPDPVLGAAATA